MQVRDQIDWFARQIARYNGDKQIIQLLKHYGVKSDLEISLIAIEIVRVDTRQVYMKRMDNCIIETPHK